MINILECNNYISSTPPFECNIYYTIIALVIILIIYAIILKLMFNNIKKDIDDLCLRLKGDVKK